MFVCQEVVKPVKRLRLRDTIICCLCWQGKDLTDQISRIQKQKRRSRPTYKSFKVINYRLKGFKEACDKRVDAAAAHFAAWMDSEPVPGACQVGYRTLSFSCLPHSVAIFEVNLLVWGTRQNYRIVES